MITTETAENRAAKRRLTLTRETLRTLTTDELCLVNGGRMRANFTYVATGCTDAGE